MANPRGCEECYASVEEACEKLVERSRVENARFSEIYGLDYFDLDHYDLVVDSSHRTPQEIVELIMQNYSIFCADPVEFGRRSENPVWITFLLSIPPPETGRKIWQVFLLLCISGSAGCRRSGIGSMKHGKSVTQPLISAIIVKSTMHRFGFMPAAGTER